jgi:hypothetical protein
MRRDNRTTHLVIEANERQRHNLERLAMLLMYLRKSQFNMGRYMSTDRSNCPLGWARLRQKEFGLVPWQEGPTIREAWNQFAIRNFGASFNDWEPGGNYLFSNLWASIGVWSEKHHNTIYKRGADPTPVGASRRILYVLEHGVPYNWEGQIKGRSPLSYALRHPTNITII